MKLRVYNKTLDPNLWTEDMKLKPEVRKHLLKIAKDFYDSTDLKGDIEDIHILGSSANYNWTPSSDIDLHLLVDISKEKLNPEYTRKIMDNFGFKWNTQHEGISIKGHKVEVYIQDIGDVNRSIGVYSIIHDEWIQNPRRENIELDKEKIKKKFHQIKDKISKFVEDGDLEKLKDLMKSITAYREAGLSKEGEFSNENIVFKALRNSGDLKRLKDSINKTYDKEATLKEVRELKKNYVDFLNESTTTIWIGIVDDNYNVRAIKTDSDSKTHTEISGYNRNDDRWRWREDTDFIFWWGSPDEDVKQAASDYIFKKTGKKILKHKKSSDFSDMQKFALHDPYSKWRNVAEEKHNPFKDKKMEFVTFGGLSLTKQKGYKGPPTTFHGPPAKRGIYAFVWPYIENFLLGGNDLVDPKSRGKGQRQRMTYIRDKDGNKITNKHPEYNSMTDRETGSEWSFARKNKDASEEDDWDDKYTSFLYDNAYRKKFSYSGPIWHHLGSHVKEENVLDRKGEWVKTDMATFKEAFKKELHSMSVSAKSQGINPNRLSKGYALDHLEVFIDRKI